MRYPLFSLPVCLLWCASTAVTLCIGDLSHITSQISASLYCRPCSASSYHHILTNLGTAFLSQPATTTLPALPASPAVPPCSIHDTLCPWDPTLSSLFNKRTNLPDHRVLLLWVLTRTLRQNDLATMDPADTNPEVAPLHQALTSQGILLGQHEQLLRALSDSNQAMVNQITQLTHQVSRLTTQLSSAVALAPDPPATPANPPSSPMLRDSYSSDPDPFTGEVTRCRGFLLQCSLVFSQRPVTFASDQSKINYIVGLLRERALAWAEAMHASQPLSSFSLAEFLDRMRSVFDHPDASGNAGGRLLRINQGSRSVADYSVEFRTLAADAGWNERALISVFVKGLSEQMKDELAARDEPTGLDAMVSLCIRMDNRLRERRQERSSRPIPQPARNLTALNHTRPLNQNQTRGVTPQTPAVPEDEPMQLGRTHLTPAERSRRRAAGECIYCGKRGHFIVSCPIRPKE